ncbi:MAG TPA: sulfatase-like hydrolase/transferase [Pyrinomonadaceae bacterium]|nr:sulfatase-like hydrolase/transferase [Pyrinomonadaceae bacterium]
MGRRLLIHTTLVITLWSFVNVLAQRTSDSSRSKPNVVLIIMDDMGYGDIGSYGAPDARTPNIDRLAREGIRLTNAVRSGPVETPDRWPKLFAL